MKPRRDLLILIAFACVIFMAMATDALACPMCKAALASHDRSQGDWVAGFFWSILFMLSMPFLLLGGISLKMYLLVRRARHEESLRKVVVDAGGTITETVTAGR